MAVMSVEPTNRTRIDYMIRELMPPYVYSASVDLFHGGSKIANRFFRAEDIEGAIGISGFFAGLTPGEVYTVQSYVYEKSGLESMTPKTGTVIAAETDPLKVIRSMHISGRDLYQYFGLIPVERPSVMPTEVKTNYVELPGSSESLDYTSILLNRVPYGQRTGEWEFYFDPDWNEANSGTLLRRKREGTLWAYAYGALLNYIHGRRHSIVLRDDDSEIYFGRLELISWEGRDKFSRVKIGYNIDPPERFAETNYVEKTIIA